MDAKDEANEFDALDARIKALELVIKGVKREDRESVNGIGIVRQEKDKGYEERINDIWSSIRSMRDDLGNKADERVVVRRFERLDNFLNVFVKANMLKEVKQVLGSGVKGDEWKWAFGFYNSMIGKSSGTTVVNEEAKETSK
jgi:hypothetical protein